jgi:hypothetical protein
VSDHPGTPEEPAAERESGRGEQEEPESTSGVGTMLAVGCTALMLIVLLAGVCIFIARQVT